MQACVDVSFPYAHVRDAFGKKIGEHQVILSNASSTATAVCFFTIITYFYKNSESVGIISLQRYWN